MASEFQRSKITRVFTAMDADGDGIRANVTSPVPGPCCRHRLSWRRGAARTPAAAALRELFGELREAPSRWFGRP